MKSASRGLTLALLLCASAAAAEVQVQAVSWQRLEAEKGKPTKAEDVRELKLEPGKTVKGRLLARLALVNRGAAADGVLLRYAMTAKVANLERPEEPAVWSVPFMIDEKRVARAGANSVFETTVDPTTMLAIYLARVYREGYWPVELKLQVMAAPRKGAGALKVVEQTLPVTR